MKNDLNASTGKFIELRAQGHSLADIAAKIHVSQRTLVAWNRKFKPDILALRAQELEDLHAENLGESGTGCRVNRKHPGFNPVSSARPGSI